MHKTILAATLAVVLLAGCSSSPENAEANSQPVADPLDTAPASPSTTTSSATTPTPSPTDETHKLGDTIDTPGGSSVTAYEYKVVTDVADHRIGAIDVEVCVGDGNTPEGVYVTTEFWSAVSDDNRRYGSPSTSWRHEEISPILDYENEVSWGDCLRGWVLTEADDDSNITKIRYFNSQSEEVGNEEIIWEVS